MLCLIVGTFKNGVTNHFLLVINIFENLEQVVDNLYRDMLVFLVRVNELGHEIDKGYVISFRDQIQIVVHNNVL